MLGSMVMIELPSLPNRPIAVSDESRDIVMKAMVSALSATLAQTTAIMARENRVLGCFLRDMYVNHVGPYVSVAADRATTPELEAASILAGTHVSYLALSLSVQGDLPVVNPTLSLGSREGRELAAGSNWAGYLDGDQNLVVLTDSFEERLAGIPVIPETIRNCASMVSFMINHSAAMLN